MTDDAVSGLPFPSDTEIDEVLAEFEGDHRMAIAALLQDLATLAGDYQGSVSKGFVRGAAPSRLKRA